MSPHLGTRDGSPLPAPARERGTTDFSTISKIQAAQEQLAEAIRLHFQRRSPIAVHTLAAAAGQLVHDLLKKQGKPSCLRDAHFLEPENRPAFLAHFNAPGNFFKHADRDAEDSLRYASTAAENMMFGAIIDFHMLTGESFHEGAVYLLWLAHRHPKLIRWEVVPEDLVLPIATFGLTGFAGALAALDGPRLC